MSQGESFKFIEKTDFALVDANNLIQTVNYISDTLGFRVAATNLPVAPGTEEQKESYWVLGE